MSLQELFLTLKGSAGSGNYAHPGRPGKHGGSSPGGGLRGLAVDRSSTPEERKQLAAVNRRLNNAKDPKHEELSKHYNLKDNCPKINCSGIRTYTGTGYNPINKGLRDGTDLGYQDEIDLMDKAFNELPRTDKEIKTRRMVSRFSIVEQMPEGGEFVDKGYVSTTISKSKDMDFFGDYKMDIIIPKGSKGAYVEDISKNEGENEFLLPRNAKFRVLRNDYLKDKGRTENRLVVEYIGEE